MAEILKSIAVIFCIQLIFLGLYIYPYTFTENLASTQYAVLFNPAQTDAENLQGIFQSDSYIVRQGITDNIYVLSSRNPEFKNVLFDQGALLVWPSVIQGACVTVNKNQMTRI